MNTLPFKPNRLVARFNNSVAGSEEMTSAIISDIHSNMEALQKALILIDDLDTDEIICLGECCGVGCQSERVH